MEAFFKLIKFPLFLVEVLDQSPSSLLHLMQSAFESVIDASGWPFDLSSVLGVPDVVGNELFYGFFPLVLQDVLVAHKLELTHESVDILNKNVISSDKNLLLLLLALTFLTFLIWTLRRCFMRWLLS